MTRDTYRLHDDRNVENEAEIYSALWTAARFPHLPEDAPNELTKLTIEVDDPKRVYVIHKAARRFQFQNLVDRYILQIRYGCDSKACITSTCFSHRKRLAGGAPVRRYNATSARTLAVYMASQDNPEQGLCHQGLFRHGHSRTSSTVKGTPDGQEVMNNTGSGLDAAVHVGKSSAGRGSKSESDTPHKFWTREGNQGRRREPDFSGLDEPVNTDHRSFVQNVFGTVAFKMLEWLAPRNLDNLAKSQNTQEDKIPSFTDSHRLQLEGKVVEHKSGQNAKDEPESTSDKNQRQNPPASPLESDVTSTMTDGIQNTSVATGSQEEPKTQENKPRESKFKEAIQPIATDLQNTTSAMPRRVSSSRYRRKSQTNDTLCSRGILSKSPKLGDIGDEITPFPSQGFVPTSKQLSRQSVRKSPTMQRSEVTIDPQDLKPPSIDITSDPVEGPRTKDDEGSAQQSVSSESRSSIPSPSHDDELSVVQRSKDKSPPQSVSFLSIEVIDFMCDILQSDGTSEKHLLHPHKIHRGQQRRRDKSAPIRRTPSLMRASGYPLSAKQQWEAFIKQSFFDVMSKPASLLRTFSNEEAVLFDTQTIWYIMLRMTRVAPSLVFDSLWNLSGILFRPPTKLEEAHDWAKEFGSQADSSQKSLSNRDAAHVMNICLHALVAAAPLVSNARQLANMSRIRSYGIAMLGRESSSLEPASLCLQYEDAFTNELSLRLARRLFAAIPIRRRFTEIMELQKDTRSVEQREPDVLDAILGTLKFLDLGTPPILNFPDDERDLHEKRVPTLILDWARTVMLQDWSGTAQVTSDGPFGGALAMMAAIYKNRKSLLLGDIHFRTEYFAERLDPVGMPLEWLSFRQNKRTVHLLDYPYLFNPSTLVTYFRAINFSRMNRVYEEAKATQGMMFSTMAEGVLMIDKNERDKLRQRLQVGTTRFMVLEIRRTNILPDTFNSIWRREERELMRPLKIRLGEEGGEEGQDSGGVQQEFFRLAIAEALDPDYGTFTIDSRTKMTWFQPGSPEPLWKFELIGMIVSLAVYNGLTLPVTFPKALYRKLLEEEVTELHHIADGWPDLASGLTSLLEWDEKDGLVEDIFARTYEFSVEQFGQPVSREMGNSSTWPQFSDLRFSENPLDAPLVTNENRNNYVSDYIRWLTDISIRPQFEAFKTGFFTVIDRRSITLFDPETLQSVVEGIQEIDISEMRRATRYIGWDASHRSIRDFWSIVKRYDLDQKRKLLEFVTASDRVPVGGMRNLQFTLQRNGIDDGHLPSSYTCYGILLLPEYSSREVLKEKLAMALENSKGFGFA